MYNKMFAKSYIALVVVCLSPLFVKQINGVRCDVGIKAVFSGNNVRDQQTTQECPSRYQCLRYSATFQESSSVVPQSGSIVWGRCVTSFTCRIFSCALIQPIILASLQGHSLTFQSCNVKCCNTYPCGTSTTPPPITTTPAYVRNPSCGPSYFTATKTPQYFAFPINGGYYKNNMYCVWNITSDQPDHGVEINFIKFSTERCCDYVKVKEPGLKPAKVRGAFKRVVYYRSNATSLSVMFKSDSTLVSTGFKMSYQTIQ